MNTPFPGSLTARRFRANQGLTQDPSQDEPRDPPQQGTSDPRDPRGRQGRSHHRQSDRREDRRHPEPRRDDRRDHRRQDRRPPANSAPPTFRRVLLEIPDEETLPGVPDVFEFSRACIEDSFSRREAPLVLSDIVKGTEQELAICVKAWSVVADALVVYSDLGVTPEMNDNIQNTSNLTVEYRVLGRKWRDSKRTPSVSAHQQQATPARKQAAPPFAVQNRQSRLQNMGEIFANSRVRPPVEQQQQEEEVLEGEEHYDESDELEDGEFEEHYEEDGAPEIVFYDE